MGAKKLSFMNTSSTSTTNNFIRILFEIPGNGIINFGTGGTVYEILAVSVTSVNLCKIENNGNACYQKLKAK